jgi:hypothetical protein
MRSTVYADETGLAACKTCPTGYLSGVMFWAEGHAGTACKSCVADYAKKKMTDDEMKHCRGITGSNYPKTLLYTVNFNNYAVSKTSYYKVGTFTSPGRWYQFVSYNYCIYLPSGTYTLCAEKTSATSNANLIIGEGSDCPAYGYSAGLTGSVYVTNGTGTGYLYYLN